MTVFKVTLHRGGSPSVIVRATDPSEAIERAANLFYRTGEPVNLEAVRALTLGEYTIEPFK